MMNWDVFLGVLCDPVTKEKLIMKDGILRPETNPQGEEISYGIEEGIPILLNDSDLKQNEYAIDLFQKEAPVYDEYKHLTFDTFFADETQVRNYIVEKIDFHPNMRILELSAGTGRDSVLIKNHLKTESELHVQDISLDMLRELKKKFSDDEVYITRSNAARLPYANDTFDAIYSFGGVGMGTYMNTSEIMGEIVRVCKKGAKVVIGNLGLGPWLYNTEFAKILIDHNDHYAQSVDLSGLPIEARNVKQEWILEGAGMILEFEVGEGEPKGNFDFVIPGKRGGTLRTRYYGKLEGVSPEVKKMAYDAREKAEISMYDFLNSAIKDAASRILNQ